jgi:hypothetical protein
MYCANRGFVGRLGLFEMMPVDASLSRLIADGAGEVEIIEEMQRRGTARLIDDAVETVRRRDRRRRRAARRDRLVARTNRSHEVDRTAVADSNKTGAWVIW